MSSITITDPAVLEQLQKGGEIEIKDGNGIVLGVFALPNFLVPPPGVKSPFTDEERAELRKQRDGRKLADILRDLEKRG